MILDRLLKRSNLATWRDNGSWLHDWVSQGIETTSGERVNAATALTVSGYYAALRAISEDVAKLPLILYERKPNGDKVRRADLPLYRFLHDQVSDNMTSMAFREVMTHHAIGWGNGFAEIETLGTGVITGLYVLSPDIVKPTMNDDGRVEYIIRERSGGERTIQADRMLHLHGLGYDGLVGYSVAHLARQSIGLSMAMEKSGASLFGNNGRPGGLLTHPHSLEGESRKNFESSWNAAMNTAAQMHKTVVLEDGMDYKAIAVPNEDAQWIEARQFSVEELARWLRIPPHKIGHLERSTFSNIEHQSIEYVSDTLQPWLVRWEQEIQRKLIRPMGTARGLFAEHLVQGLLRGDIATRYTAYSTARQWGWMSANDVRRLENENSIGESGDIYLVPMNMVDAKHINDLPADEKDGTENGAGDESMRRAMRVIVSEEVRERIRESSDSIDAVSGVHVRQLAESYAKALRIEATQLAKAAKRKDLDMSRWSHTWYAEHEKHVRGALIPAVDTFCESIWAMTVGGSMPEGVSGAIAGHTAAMASRHVAESLAEIDSGSLSCLESWRDGTRASDVAALEMRDLVTLMRDLCGERYENRDRERQAGQKCHVDVRVASGEHDDQRRADTQSAEGVPGQSEPGAGRRARVRREGGLGNRQGDGNDGPADSAAAAAAAVVFAGH